MNGPIVNSSRCASVEIANDEPRALGRPAGMGRDRVGDEIDVGEAVEREASPGGERAGHAAEHAGQEADRRQRHDSVAATATPRTSSSGPAWLGRWNSGLPSRCPANDILTSVPPSGIARNSACSASARITDSPTPRIVSSAGASGGRPRSLVLDDDLDRLGLDVHAHAERAGLALVGVHDHVVARLADRGLEVVQQLRVEPDQLGHPRQHAPHERQRLGPRVELEANGRRIRLVTRHPGMLLTGVCGVNLCPVMDSHVRALYKIDAQPGGPAQARRIIAEELSTVLSPAELNDVKLLVSELVTNGIVHGGGENDVPVMLDLCVNGHIRCAVLDQGPGFAARIRENRRAGWGLRLVEQLSDRWGMECSPRRTEVWFERNCP